MTAKKAEEKLTFRQEAANLFATRYRAHEPLAEYTANSLGGIADNLITCLDANELMAAAKLALKHHLPYRVLGHGYGSLISDVGCPGLVIINQSNKLFLLPEVGQVMVESGLSNDQIINMAARHGLGGLEFLANIPGTIGGAISSQATYGSNQIDQFVRELAVFLPDKDGGQIINVTLNNYRDQESLYQLYRQSDYPPIIINVRLQFVHLSNEEVLARLVKMRQFNLKQPKERSLGYIFNHDLQAILLTLPNYRKLKLTTIQFWKHNLNIIMLKPKVKPTEVRRDLETLASFLKENGHDLAFRLSFVGYWPSEEENSQTGTAVNPESI